jgi:hypothetical protein
MVLVQCCGVRAVLSVGRCTCTDKPPPLRVIQRRACLLCTSHRSMFTCDTGGHLNKVTHFYHYRVRVRARAGSVASWVGALACTRSPALLCAACRLQRGAPPPLTPPLTPQDLEEREAVRTAAAVNSQWQAFIAASRPHVASQVRRGVVGLCWCRHQPAPAPATHTGADSR